MPVLKKCIAKLIKKLDGEWTLNNNYICSDIGDYYLISDNRGGTHNIIKTGKLATYFKVSEVD